MNEIFSFDWWCKALTIFFTSLSALLSGSALYKIRICNKNKKEINNIKEQLIEINSEVNTINHKINSNNTVSVKGQNYNSSAGDMIITCTSDKGIIDE